MREVMSNMGEFLFGFANGERFNVANTPEQIAAFIIAHQHDDVKITSIFDIMLITTSGQFLNYVEDQEYLRDELLPVLVPMQRGEVESIEFVPYQLVSEDSVLAKQEQVELNGVTFDVVVTREPYIIHLLEQEGTKVVTDVMDSTWEAALVKLLGLSNDESYQIYCYCFEDPVILEYGFTNDDGIAMFTQVYDDEPVWSEYFEIIQQRKK